MGIVVAPAGRLVLALRLTIDTGDAGDAGLGPRISGIDTIADPARLAALDLAVLPGGEPQLG